MGFRRVGSDGCSGGQLTHWTDAIGLRRLKAPPLRGTRLLDSLTGLFVIGSRYMCFQVSSSKVMEILDVFDRLRAETRIVK